MLKKMTENLTDLATIIINYNNYYNLLKTFQLNCQSIIQRQHAVGS